jgi:hypothetical protein
MWEICGDQSSTEAGFSMSIFNVFTANIIPPLVHTHFSLPLEPSNCTDLTADITSLVFKLGASSLTWHLAGYGSKELIFLCIT